MGGVVGEEKREERVEIAFSFILFFCMGVLLPPRLAHSAPVEVGGSDSLRAFLVSALLWHIPLRGDALF